MIRASDTRTSQFASGTVWLTQRNIGCTYHVQRKEVSLNNYKSDVTVSYNNREMKYSLTETEEDQSFYIPKRIREMSAPICRQTGVKCKVERIWLPYQEQINEEEIWFGYQPIFNMFGLLDYFGITDPVIRDKFENLQVKNIDGTNVLIVN